MEGQGLFTEEKDAVDFLAGKMIKSNQSRTEKAEAVPPIKALPGFHIANEVTASYIKNSRLYRDV